MKQFWTIVMGSFVGVWIALMLFSIVPFVMSIALMGTMSSLGKGSSATITDNTVLKIDLGCNIVERNTGDFDFMSMLMNDERPTVGLDEMLHAIAVAKDDDRFSGIYLECNGLSAGTSAIYEIRQALEDFKTESGKFIYAYGDNFSQGDYYIASVADSIYVNTIGDVDLRGLSVSMYFMKKFLDKIGVEMQVVRVGTFKSAVEPYILDEMSEANRLQYQTFINNIWGNMTEAISKSRNISVARLNEMTDSIYSLQETQYLIANNIVDAACYKHEFDDKLKVVANVNSDDDINFVAPSDLLAEGQEKKGDGKIAVIYAVGEIIDGDSDGEIINSIELTKTILDVAKDDDVDGVVLRVNSPGGSAYGSEQIWNALEMVKESGKPLAVSMSDMAASGGYYISCGADRIFAEPLTLTGSIGVFGVIPYAGELLENKLGLTENSVSTNENSTFPSLAKKFTPSQAAALQRMVNSTYERFTSRCAEGRNMPVDSIKKIAEGRVWDGINAIELGLVDQFGTLDDAIEWVAAEAAITDNYEIIIAPEPEDFFTKLFSSYATTKMEAKMKEELGPLYEPHKELKRIMQRNNVLCLTPEVVIVQ